MFSTSVRERNRGSRLCVLTPVGGDLFSCCSARRLDAQADPPENWQALAVGPKDLKVVLKKRPIT